MYKMVTGVRPPVASEVLMDGLPPIPSSITSSTKELIAYSMSPRRNDRPQNIKYFLAFLDNNSVFYSKHVDNDDTYINAEVVSVKENLKGNNGNGQAKVKKLGEIQKDKISKNYFERNLKTAIWGIVITIMSLIVSRFLVPFSLYVTGITGKSASICIFAFYIAVILFFFRPVRKNVNKIVFFTCAFIGLALYAIFSPIDANEKYYDGRILSVGSTKMMPNNSGLLDKFGNTLIPANYIAVYQLDNNKYACFQEISQKIGNEYYYLVDIYTFNGRIYSKDNQSSATYLKKSNDSRKSYVNNNIGKIIHDYTSIAEK